MYTRIFLLACFLFCCGGTLLAQQRAFKAKPAEINTPEKGTLAQSLKAWKVFSLDGLEEPVSASTMELSFEWGSRVLRFSGRHEPLTDQHSTLIEIGPGYRRTHAFPQLLQFRGKGIRMIIGKDFILGEYADQGKKYIVEQLGHFVPGAAASRVVVYDAADVIDRRPATCGAEAVHKLQSETTINREKTDQPGKTAGTCRIVDVAVMANSTSYREHGSSLQETAAYIAAIYSLTEGDYTSAFTDDFRFHLTELVVSTSAETDPWLHTDDIYRNLGNFWNFAITEFQSPHDLSSYWFRTQGFSGGVIGLAYMGFTCNTVGDAAIREFGGSAQTMRCLLSHEIGHNFNMSHDAAGSGFIMAPSINGSKTFSENSKTSFESFVGSGAAACITACDAGDCERSQVQDVRATMSENNREFHVAWRKTPGSQGYIVRWWERGSTNVMTRQLDSLAEEVRIPLDCSDASFLRVEVALVCSNGRPGTYTGLDLVNNAVPRIVLDGLDMICPGATTRIRSSLSAGNQWLRDGEPIPGATGQELVVTQPGSYTVRNSNAGGCSYLSNELFIVQNLSAERPRISPDGATEFCDGGRVLLSATPADRYQWLRNGTEITGEQNRTLSAISSGIYSVRVETADKCVMISDSIRVQANPLPDLPRATASSALQLCPGDSIQFSTDASSGIQWYRNDTAIAGATNAWYIASQAGRYQVEVTNEFSCRRISADQEVVAASLPQQPLLTATGDLTVCEGDTVHLQTDATGSIQWLLDGMVLDNITASRFYAPKSGVYRVRVSNAAGCTATSDALTVNFLSLPAQPTVQASGATTICRGERLTLETSATTGIRWLRNGAVIAGATDRSIEITEGGTYIVDVTNAGGCTSTSTALSITVVERPSKPTITPAGTTSFCQGSSVELSTDASAGIQWYRDGIAITNANSRTLRVTQTGVYGVQANNANGCSSPGAETVSVTVFDNPARPPLNWNGTELSTLVGFKTYRWLKDGVEIPGAVSNTYRPASAGNYRTAVTDNNNCLAESENYPLVITGLQDVVIAGASIKCFPNPAREAIHLQVTNPNTLTELSASLVDMHGRFISRQKLVSGVNRFETGNLAPGMYVLVVTDGKDRQIIKFVLSR